MSTPSRRSNVRPFLAMEVGREAARLEGEGRRIVHLELGEPGSPAPRAAREAARAALEEGRLGYTAALGRPSLRARIARHYAERYGVRVPDERVVVTTGSSGGFVLAFLALFDPGARVAIAAPGYPAYRNTLAALSCEVVTIETDARDGHVVTPAAIVAAHRAGALAGVLLMSPANPTGRMMDAHALAGVCATCERLGIRFISDEIYHGLTYGAPAATVLALSDEAVVINSFSKYYCMTGWRVGWMVVPVGLVRAVERLSQSLSISVATLSQIGAEAAFDASGDLEAVRAGYARNRALLLDALPKLGMGDIVPADGAFYAYADIGRLTNDSVSFCRRMLVEAGVAATPGIDFDPARGHRTVRFSFAGSEGDVREAIARLAHWMNGPSERSSAP